MYYVSHAYVTYQCDLANDYKLLPELVNIIWYVILFNLGAMFNIMNVRLFAHTLFSSSYTLIGVHCYM